MLSDIDKVINSKNIDNNKIVFLVKWTEKIQNIIFHLFTTKKLQICKTKGNIKKRLSKGINILR